MSIPSNYEINVAKDKVHFCKIELGMTTEENALKKFSALKEIFGAEYELRLTHWVCYGEIVKEET